MGLSGIWTHDHLIPFRCVNPLSSQAMSSTRTQSQHCTATPISSLRSVFTFDFGHCRGQLPHLLEVKSRTGIHMSAAEWTDTYCIHHWRILRSSYRNLVWVGFEPATEFPSDALTDWAIRPCAQLALRAIFVQLQLHLFVQCFHFISDIAFVSSQIYFKRNLAQVFT